MNRTFSLLMVLLANPVYGIPKPIPAVCIVPVADLLSQKLSATEHHTIDEKYAFLPLSEKQPASLCCRATQLLFNERVTIIEQSGEQSYVETSFWHLKNSSCQSPSTRNNRFWTLTKNLKPLSTLNLEENNTIPLTDPENFKEKVITLTLPWNCYETNTSYSAGTQFVITGQSDDHYQIKFYSPKASTILESALLKDICVLTKKRTDEQKRILFLITIQRWAHGIPDSIPYVLGGASILETFKDVSFYEKKMIVDKIKSTAFIRPECTAIPHTGVDCAGLIRLACKVAGIPLTATNSKSIARSLFKLEPTTALQNGDIIFWNGHVAVVSDVKQGLLIEARGYENGYGLVQEIPYSLELEGLTTTDNLMDSYIRKAPIQRLDKQGNYRKIITDLTILSLLPVKPMAWENV